MSDLKKLTNEGYEAFSKGDMETLTRLIADDAVWHVDGEISISGDYEGRDAIFGLFATIGQHTEGTMDMQIKRVNVLGDELVQTITSTSAKHGDKSVSGFIEAHLARWQNGQLVEFWGTMADQKVALEFWGPKG
ncbi:MAG: nuclear transport factor 2 family protein [Polyangiaceae bacterium]